MRRMRKNTLIAMAALVFHLNAEGSRAEVVPVVSADSPVDALSRIQIVNIFLGKSGQFPNGTRAQPVDQKEGKDARTAFYRKFAGQSEAQIRAHWSKLIFTGRGRPPKALEDGEAVKAWVADKRNAIGYIDSGLVDDSVKIVNVK